MEMFMSAFTEELQNRRDQGSSVALTQKQQLETAERQIANIMQAISAGIITPSTKEALQRAEADRDKAKQALEADAKAIQPTPDLVPNALGRYRAMTANLARFLSTDVAQARECLKGIMGQIRLLPNETGGLQVELRHCT